MPVRSSNSFWFACNRSYFGPFAKAISRWAPLKRIQSNLLCALARRTSAGAASAPSNSGRRPILDSIVCPPSPFVGVERDVPVRRACVKHPEAGVVYDTARRCRIGRPGATSSAAAAIDCASIPAAR